ncbi:hypothetical protein ACM6VE_001053 [Vibrio parahaemolyticus]
MKPESICAESIRVSAIIKHVEDTLNHWTKLKTKPTILHRNKLLSELREIESLSAQHILDTQ